MAHTGVAWRGVFFLGCSMLFGFQIFTMDPVAAVASGMMDDLGLGRGSFDATLLHTLGNLLNWTSQAEGSEHFLCPFRRICAHTGCNGETNSKNVP